MNLLVAYSDSSSSSSDSDVSDRKTKRLKESSSRAVAASEPGASSALPPAAALLDGTYSPPPVHEQHQLAQTLLHQGRPRRFPHVTGSFPTHVYITVDTPASCLPALNGLLLLLRERLPGLQPTTAAGSTPTPAPSSVAGAAPPAVPRQLAKPRYHVSLSHTVSLRPEQAGPLAEELRRRLRHQEAFSMRMGAPEVFCNDERSRTFLALRACGGCQRDPAAGQAEQEERQRQQRGGAEAEAEAEAAGDRDGAYCPPLVAACHVISRLFRERGLPPFHEDPRPHASVAWLLGDHAEALQAALAEPGAQAAAAKLAQLQWTAHPAVIVCKVGHQEHAVWGSLPG